MQLSVHVIDLRNVITCVLRFVFSLVNAVRIMKFYVVFKGRKPRVYTTWMECDHEVLGYPGNLHSSYATRREAEEAYAQFKKLELGDPGQ